jgi:hypothetical protein
LCLILSSFSVECEKVLCSHGLFFLVDKLSASFLTLKKRSLIPYIFQKYVL